MDAPSMRVATLDRGTRLLGHPMALDRLFKRLHAGHAITIGVLGASVGQNGGCLDQPGKRCMGYRGHNGNPVGFAVRLLRHINCTWPADHRINNSALDGTGAEHTAHCIVGHLPPQLDLVIAEWGSMALHTIMALPSIERIARVLLARSSPPVLLHLSVHEWCSQRITPRVLYRVGDVLRGSLKQWVFPDTPWAAVEEEATRVSRHYGQPAVSVHAALAPHVLNHEEGFQLDDVTGPDCLHPINGRYGVQYVEALLTHWFDRAHALWRHANAERRDMLRVRTAGGLPASMGLGRDGGGGRLSLGAYGAGVLPAPLHNVNADERVHTKCYAFMHETVGMPKQAIMQAANWCSADTPSNLISVVAGSRARTCWGSAHQSCPRAIDTKGFGRAAEPGSRAAARATASQAAYASFMRAPPSHWFYCGVSLGETKRKISAGLVAMRPGAELRVRVDGWASSSAQLALEHLVSYEGMGTARLECIDSCTCEAQTIDAHKTSEIRNTSVFVEHRFPATRALGNARPCEVRLTLLDETRSGAHKFKVRAITVTSTVNGADEARSTSTTVGTFMRG